jgi:hypothetical protein
MGDVLPRRDQAGGARRRALRYGTWKGGSALDDAGRFLGGVNHDPFPPAIRCPSNVVRGLL